MKIEKVFYFLLLIFFVQGQVEATEISHLNYPAELNDITIVPQRFEYGILGPEQFHVGPILLNLENVKLRIKGSRHSSTWTWEWPSRIFDQGELILKDGTGRIVWRHEIQSQRVETQETTFVEPRSKLSLTAALARYARDVHDDQVINRLIQVGPFSFCVFARELSSQIELCSRPMNLSVNASGQLVIQVSVKHHQHFVEIEGQKIGETGIFFVESKEVPLQFRAFSKTDARINLIVRRRSVQFRNVTRLSREKVKLEMTGADPWDESLGKKLDGGYWALELDQNRPRIYLKGEMAMPFQQEFYIKKEVMKYPEVAFSAPELDEGYASSVSIKLKAHEPIRGKVVEKGSEIASENEGELQWRLQDLKFGSNLRKIGIEAAGTTYIGEFHYQRYSGNELIFSLLSDSGLVFDFQRSWNRWISSSLFYESLPPHDLTDRVSLKGLQIGFNILPGIKQRDFLPSLLGGATQLSSGDFSANAVVMGLGFRGPLSGWLTAFGESFEFNWKTIASSMSQTYKLAGLGRLELLFKWPLWAENELRVGGHYNSYKLSTEAAEIEFKSSALLVGFSVGF